MTFAYSRNGCIHGLIGRKSLIKFIERKKMKLISIRPRSYLGEVKNFNIKTSDRTGRTYLNLYLNLYVEEQEVDIQKSYCLDMGRNLHIMRIMKEVEALKKNGEANFDKLLEYYFWVNVSYDQYGQLTVNSLKVVQEGELEEPEDEIEEEFEDENYGNE